MIHFRLIGDVHGYYGNYWSAAQGSFCSFQVGDLGLDYNKLPELDSKKHVFIGGNHDNYTLKLTDLSLDARLGVKNTIIGFGEHNFAEQHVGYLDEVLDVPRVYEFSKMPDSYLGNFGIWRIPEVEPDNLSGEIFFVRGAWSIDGDYRRLQGRDWKWFPREQLSIAEGTAALALYEQTKPDFVVTHEVPTKVLSHLRLLFSDGRPIPTQTGRCLNMMHEIHQPKLWVFGHFHQEFDKVIDGTRFICLNQAPEDGWLLDFDRQLNIIP